ncbi:MAG: peptidoglycan DD-metalloendopeptidase family protein [bacterium]
MYKQLDEIIKYFSTLIILFFASHALSQNGGHFGAPAPISECIVKNSYLALNTSIEKLGLAKSSGIQAVRTFFDPMPNGGTNAFGQTVTNYVDLEPSDGLRDYNCGSVTYDGHRGLDIEIVSFYDMDEGVPILCAAPGVVIFVNDGEFDRQTEWINGAVANAVTVRHADGSDALYWHIRKNSVRVTVGDSVAVGDTLGYIGSSGFSSGPHLHFEIRKNGTIDPFQGNCQSDSSRWVKQGDYVLNLPFEVMAHGLTTIPIDWPTVLELPPSKTHVRAGERIYSWLRLRNIKGSDVLRWEFWANGAFWNSHSFSPDQTYSSSYWYVFWELPVNPSLYGNWSIKIFRNGDQIAEQPFLYDSNANQLPAIPQKVIEVQKGGEVTGELVGEDSDGAIFWYEAISRPKHGGFSQFGGRKRKFIYRLFDDFVGQDTLIVAAIDDENAEGLAGMYIFDVKDQVTGIALIDDRVPAEFSLAQNYPNPFNPTTRIQYSIGSDQHVNLKVFDVMGQEVATLVNVRQEPGTYRVTFDARGLASGLYLARMVAGKFAATRKIVFAQ